MQPGQPRLCKPWWSKESHYEETALLPGWILVWAAFAPLIVHSAHSGTTKYSLASDENSARLPGIMDDSCCRRQTPFFPLFSPRTLSAPPCWSCTMIFSYFCLWAQSCTVELICTEWVGSVFVRKSPARCISELWPNAAGSWFQSEEKNIPFLLFLIVQICWTLGSDELDLGYFSSCLVIIFAQNVGACPLAVKMCRTFVIEIKFQEEVVLSPWWTLIIQSLHLEMQISKYQIQIKS